MEEIQDNFEMEATGNVAKIRPSQEPGAPGFLTSQARAELEAAINLVRRTFGSMAPVLDTMMD